MKSKKPLISDTDEQMQKKIKQLRQMVYPKKRKPVLQTKSYRSLSNNKLVLNISKKANYQKFQHKNQFDKDKDKGTLPQNNEQLKKTNLQFMSHHKSSTNFNTSVPWTIQNWMPVNNNTEALKKKFFDSKYDKFDDHFAKRNRFASVQQKNVSLKSEFRDAQSLLRKNSLFLLNFIRTRQKKLFQRKSADEFPMIFEQIKHQSPQKPGRQERQKHYLESIKVAKQEQKKQKITNLLQNPIYPQPW